MVNVLNPKPSITVFPNDSTGHLHALSIASIIFSFFRRSIIEDTGCASMYGHFSSCFTIVLQAVAKLVRLPVEDVYFNPGII